MGRVTASSKMETRNCLQIPPVFLASHSNGLPVYLPVGANVCFCKRLGRHQRPVHELPGGRFQGSQENNGRLITVRRLLPHALLHLFATELSNGLKPNLDLKGIIGHILLPSLTTPGTPQF